MLFLRFVLASVLFVVLIAGQADPPKATGPTNKAAKPGAKVEKGTTPTKPPKLAHTERRFCNTGKLGKDGKPVFKLCKTTEKGKTLAAKDAPKPDGPGQEAVGDVKVVGEKAVGGGKAAEGGEAAGEDKAAK